MDSGEVLRKCRRALRGIKAINLEQFIGPVVKKARRIESPASCMSKALSFTEIELASSQGLVPLFQFFSPDPDWRFQHAIVRSVTRVHVFHLYEGFSSQADDR
jgi:hypothetical protein